MQHNLTNISNKRSSVSYRLVIGLVILSIFATSCETIFVPKPTGYHKIELPDHQYVQLQEKHPYTFQHSVYATVSPHQSRHSEPHWIDIHYPSLGADVQLTYKVLEADDKKNKLKEDMLNEITSDARKLTSQHNIKAYSIEEQEIMNKNGISSYIFELTGEVPSQFQFYATDSTQNFLRGALYFKTATKNDSLAPVIEFIKVDIAHMLNTLDWVEE